MAGDDSFLPLQSLESFPGEDVTPATPPADPVVAPDDPGAPEAVADSSAKEAQMLQKGGVAPAVQRCKRRIRARVRLLRALSLQQLLLLQQFQLK